MEIQMSGRQIEKSTYQLTEMLHRCIKENRNGLYISCKPQYHLELLEEIIRGEPIFVRLFAWKVCQHQRRLRLTLGVEGGLDIHFTFKRKYQDSPGRVVNVYYDHIQ
jgi:hypothetical protein